MADPAYADYAAWMERNALVPRFFDRLRGLPGNDCAARTCSPHTCRIGV